MTESWLYLFKRSSCFAILKFQASLGSAQSQNPLLKNKLQSGINKFSQGIKKGAIETGHGLVKVGKGVKKMTKKTVGNFGSGNIFYISMQREIFILQIFF